MRKSFFLAGPARRCSASRQSEPAFLAAGLGASSPPAEQPRPPGQLFGRENVGTACEHGATDCPRGDRGHPPAGLPAALPRNFACFVFWLKNAPPKRRRRGLLQATRARPGDVLRSQLPINYGWKQIRKSQFCMSRVFRSQRRLVAGSRGRQIEPSNQVGKLPDSAAMALCRN